MNRFNEIDRKTELEAMKRPDIMNIIKYKMGNGIDLPSNWSKMKNDELINLILQIEGDETMAENKTSVEAKSENILNPFNEKIVETVLPIDPLNPKIKTIQITVNFKPLIFPLGKKAKMPKSYYDAYMYSKGKDNEVYMKMQENRMKEI